jgi:hypothetical protein
MAKNDIRIHSTGGLNVVPTKLMQTEAAATAILAGEPVILKSAGSPYVIPAADGDPVIGTTTQVMGIAAGPSTHTASADGSVEVYLPADEIIFEAKAKTASTVDTLAELNALVNDRVVWDLTSSTYTVDASAGDGATKGIQIVGGDPDRSVVYFKIRPAAFEAPIA